MLRITITSIGSKPTFTVPGSWKPLNVRLYVKRHYGYQDNGLPHCWYGMLSCPIRPVRPPQLPMARTPCACQFAAALSNRCRSKGRHHVSIEHEEKAMHSSTHTLSQDRKANGYDQEEAWFHEHNRRLLEGLKAKQKKEAAEVKQPASGQPASF